MDKSIREQYLNISKNALGKKYIFICDEDEEYIPVGQGGSGIVYAANQIFSDNEDVYSKRAVKFFIFRDDLMKKLGYVSNDNFDIEIKNISRFNHQNILKVVDGNYYNITINEQDVKIPYTVTEFIEGPNLEDLFNKKNISICTQIFKDEEDIFVLFSQIVTGIAYLHKNNFYHCDIAPKNIFLKPDENNEFLAVIGDLGAGKTIEPKTFNQTKVIGTRDYMPPDVRAIKDTEIDYEEFCKIQPGWDLFSLVLTLKNIIQEIKKNDLFVFDCWNIDRLYEQLIEKKYSTLEDIARDIDKLRPSSNQILKLDELSEASKNIGQILIPINSAYLSKRMRKLSKHDMLLRLMDVPQLLEGATTFPGANHTRYEHTLGTYELMRKAMLALLRNKEYTKFLSEKYVISGLISALLSSLINYPYSYAIHELQSQENSLFPELSSLAVFDALINEKSIVTDKSLSECITELFGEYKISIDDLKYVIFGKKGTRNRELDILHSLLNSSVGVRIIDYMMRDSHHIGLTYKIDTNDLFKSMSLSNGEFCLRQSGITLAEQIISNRYWLFKRIYWSDPNRAHAALLKHMFYTVNGDGFSKELLSKIHSLSTTEVQNLIIKYSNDNKSSIEKSVALLNQKGQTRYKSVLVLDKNSKYPNANDICSAFEKLNYTDQHEIRDKLEIMFIEKYNIPKESVNLGAVILVDMPYESPGNKLGSDIRIHRYDDVFLPLDKASGIISGLRASFEDQLMLLRVYVRPDIFYNLTEERKIDRSYIEEFLSGKLNEIL